MLRVVVLVVLAVLRLEVVVLVLLQMVLFLALGLRLQLGVGLGFEDRLEVEEDLVPEVWGDGFRAGGGDLSLLPAWWGGLCGGRGAFGSLLCCCGFGFDDGLVEEGGAEG